MDERLASNLNQQLAGNFNQHFQAAHAVPACTPPPPPAGMLQVLRLRVEAAGFARRMCAPREVLVERLWKKEDQGIDVVLFSSIQQEERQKQRGRRLRLRAQARGEQCPQQQERAGVAAVQHPGGLSTAAGLALMVAAVAVAVGLQCMLAWAAAALIGGVGIFISLWHWRRPVVAVVRGGYTISPREDCRAGGPPECLVTCILKVGCAVVSVSSEAAWTSSLHCA